MEIEQSSRRQIENEACLPPDKKKAHKVDHLTEIIGVFGPFHLIIYLAMSLSIILHGWQMFSNKFYTYPTDFWCERPLSQGNFTKDTWLNISAPLKLVKNAYEFDKCAIFDIDFDGLNTRPDESTPTIPCKSWEYAGHFDVSILEPI